MKTMKKLLPLLLCMIMVVTAFAVTASAAGSKTNVTISISATEVNVGDTITVKLGITEMTASSLAFGFDFDTNLLEVSSITAKRSVALDYYDYDPDADEWFEDELDCTSVSTKAEANNSGHVGVVFANDHDVLYYEKEAVVTIKFTALAAGTVEFEMFEDSAGPDGYKDTWTATENVIIKEAEPECEHKVTKEVSNNDGKTHKIVCADESCGATVTESVSCSGGKATCTAKAKCSACGQEYGELAEHSFNSKDSGKQATAADCTNPAKNYVQCDNCDAVSNTKTVEVGEAKGHGHTLGFRYDPNSDGTHNVVCADCDQITEENVKCEDGDDADELCDKCDNNLHVCAHDHYDVTDTTHQSICSCGEKIGDAEAHDFNNDAHTCVCGDVEKFTLTVDLVTEEQVQLTVPYGANLFDTLTSDSRIHTVGTRIRVENNWYNGIRVVDCYYYIGGTGPVLIVSGETKTMPASDLRVYCSYITYGWNYSDGNKTLYLSEEAGRYLSGWNYIEEDYDDVEGGAWYYFDDAYYLVTGLTRVPYNTELGHSALAEDLAYNPEFKDASEAWYYFDENGKYESTKNGIIDGKYVVDGMIPWHPGFVTVAGELYYFVGDAENGGNKAADGDIYVTRVNGTEGFANGDVYNFVNGKPSGLNDIANGKYYENSKLMMGAGLIKVEDGKYIYVRSNGELAVGEYWVSANKTNDLPVKGGKCYTFDENGYLQNAIDPSKDGIIDGVYYKQGEPYYAGLIEIDGVTYYVNSSGKVVTGEYYVTKTNGNENIKPGTKLIFDKDGKMQPIKNGIVEENDILYYYENNHILYGEGVVELTDDEGKIFYIYVKSNGQLATGKYYPDLSKLNGLLERKSGGYDWGTDGKYYPAD